MSDELRELLDRLDRRLATGDRLSASFARELARVWVDAERALRDLLLSSRSAGEGVTAEVTRGALLLDRVRRILESSGYDALVTAAMTESANALIAEALAGRDIRNIAGLVQPIERSLSALRDIAIVDLFQQGNDVATALWRSLVQHLFTTRPLTEILADLADALDEELAAVRTLFDTQLSIFGRQVEAAATEDLGPEQPFLYAGPIDDVTRPWCLARVGQVFTRAAIDAMDNGQLPNPMLTGGGYNCRHSFIAVESQALRDLTGTGSVVEPYASELERIRIRKAVAAAKRKKRAA